VKLGVEVRGSFAQLSKAIILDDLVIIDESIVKVVVLIVIHGVVLVGLLSLHNLSLSRFFVFVFLVVFSFLCCGGLVPAILLNWSQISLDLNSSKHWLNEVLEAMAAFVDEGFRVVFVVSQIFTLDFALVESFLNIIWFFVVSLLFFEQFCLLGLNSKISLARTYLNQVVLI
jgi:hypothetical protein